LSAETLARAAFALLLLAGPVTADVFRSGEIRLQAGEAPGAFELVANLPSSAARATAIEWPSGCRQTDLRVQALGDGRTLLHYRAACDRAPGLRDLIRTPWQVDAARLDHDFAGTPSSATLTPSAGGLVIPFRTAAGADRSWTEPVRVRTSRKVLGAPCHTRAP
jgi:hypothetical protein